MKIGIALPSMVDGLTRSDALAWMRAIDAGPFSVLGAGERIAYPNQEMMTLLAGAATVTERVRIEASVGITPMHAAIHVAKQAATIDVLSGGRFVLGVGVGGRDEDYRAMDAPFARRHATLDEQVAIMRRVWRGDAPMEGVGPVGPAPVQAGGPPVLAAAMGPKSMARAARWSDGVAGFDIRRTPSGSARASGGSKRRGPTPDARVARCCRRRSGSGSTTTRPPGCATTRSATCASSAMTPRARWRG